MDTSVRVFCPIYLLTSSERCWSCGHTQSVVALGTHFLVDDQEEYGDLSNVNDLILLSYITSMPSEVFEYISKKNSRYQEHYSRTAEESYYSNICECGANFGDHFLFSEPGHAFFPNTKEEAEAIRYHKMPFQGELAFDCSWSEGNVGEFILDCARNEHI